MYENKEMRHFVKKKTAPCFLDHLCRSLESVVFQCINTIKDRHFESYCLNATGGSVWNCDYVD